MSEPSDPFFRRYTRLADEADIVAAMRSQPDVEWGCLRGVPIECQTVVSPPFAWTIRQVVVHCADTERVMTYRALRFARGDATPLPGFDQDPWAANSNANTRRLDDLVDEWRAVRHASIALFASLSPDAWTRSGTAANLPWTVDDLARVVVGHARHHLAIVKRRLQD